jgi:diguanylate cyclase (GGDEF)-like protein
LIAEKPQCSWRLILIDVDSLKNINDEFGQQAGDDVLVSIASILKSIKGDDDIMIRWSGEEFLWLAKTATTNSGQQHCEQLQQKLSEQVIKAQGYKVKITCSLGFTNFPMQSYKALDWDWAIKLADHALHKAKDSGRNQWYGLNLNPGKEFDYSTSDDVQELIDSGVLSLIGKK